MRKHLLLLCAMLMASAGIKAQNPDDFIQFEDPEAEKMCRVLADKNSDGKVSYKEAENVKSLSLVFMGNNTIKKLHELKYFTGVKSIDDFAFSGASSLEEITLPPNLETIGREAFCQLENLRVLNINDKLKSIDDRAMKSCVSLETIKLPETLTSMGISVFSNCNALKEIRIPGSIGKVPYQLLANCTSLEKVEICEGIKMLESQFILGCTNLKQLSLPSTLESFSVGQLDNLNNIERVDVAIGCPVIQSVDGVLYEAGLKTLLYYPSASKLKVYVTPNKLQNIETNAITNARNLEKVVITNGVKVIYSNAFQKCERLKEVDMFGCDISFFPNVFVECDSLAKIILPSKLVKVFDSSFENLKSLKSINIPLATQEIGANAFKGCTSLEGITIPKNINYISDNAFDGCKSLDSLVIKSSSCLFGHNSFRGCDNMNVIKIHTSPYKLEGLENSQIIPGETNNRIVYFYEKYRSEVEMALYWMDANEIRYMQEENNEIIQFADSNVKSLCVKNWDVDNDGEISYEEAANVDNLNNVFHSSEIKSFNELKYFTGLISIDDSDFYSCSSLETVALPESILTIGRNAFANCKSLKNVEFGNSLISLQEFAFYLCTSLDKVKLPSTVEFIDKCAFSCCAFTSFEIPMKVCSFDEDQLSGCKALKDITVAEGNECFTAVDGVLYSKDMKTIIFYAVGNERTEFTIPESVEEISYNAFSGSQLQTITIPETVTVIGKGAFSGSKLKNIKLPENIKTISNSLFEDCSDLENVEFSNSITKIEANAFNSCSSIKVFKIPASVKEIGTFAFVDTYNMNEIYVYSETGDIANVENSFIFPTDGDYNIVANERVIYVPQGCKSNYLNHPYWSHAKEILEIGETPSVIKNIGEASRVISINGINFKFSDKELINIYTIDGVLHGQVKAGEDNVSLAAGIYIIEGRKIIVR